GRPEELRLATLAPADSPRSYTWPDSLSPRIFVVAKRDVYHIQYVLLSSEEDVQYPAMVIQHHITVSALSEA
ncbi:hypothetical protein XENORESO_015249, partial [Xenotaenia resolanae]